ncbi:BppU family phage baseplate upper protein [Bacillus cereus group sp. BceL293]|uniref:BppU family phage baseplate upper protein n=1 Tax=Bacillus cereus group sp. BceL293 TaxID=3444992 RepID=UPI003F226AF9
MNNQSYEITVDTQKSINHSNIEFSQNNLNISELIFNITEDGKELPLNDTDEIIVYFKKPDKTVVFQDKEIELLDKTKGKIKVLLTTQTLVKAGDVEGEISIGRVENGTKKRTSTYGFSFKVRSSLASNDSIESTNEFQMFDQLLELGKQDIPAIIASKETAEQALKKSDENANQIGILSELETTEKSNLVKAINEAKNSGLTEQQEQDLAAVSTTKNDVENLKANKMDKTTLIPISQFDKNKGLIDETYLSDTLKSQMAGTTAIGSTPPDKSITLKKTTFYKLGKNLFDKATVTLNSYVKNADGTIGTLADYFVSNFIPVIPNTTYTRTHNHNLAFYTDTKTYISGISSTLNTLTFTTPANCYFVRVSAATSNLDKYQVELGSATTLYEPYIEIIPKTLTEKHDILESDLPPFPIEKIAGAKLSTNKFDKNAVKQNTSLNLSTGAETTNANFATSDFIPVESQTKYLISDCRGIVYYNSSKQFISSDPDSASKTNYVVTTPANSAYMRFYVYDTTNMTNRLAVLQVNKGTELLPYEQYAYKIPKNNLDLTNIDETPSINFALSDKVYGVVGKETSIYFYNVLDVPLDGLQFDVTCDVGMQQKRRWVVTPSAAGTFPLTIAIYKNYKFIKQKTVTFIVKAATAGSGNKKVLVIGDSTINQERPTQRLLDLTTSDTVKVTLLGTRGSGANKHEGRGGWSFQKYRTNEEYGGAVNPFYNPAKSDFDFPYYMTSQGYSAPDYLIISLGINDTFSPSSDSSTQSTIATVFAHADFIVNNIKSYNSAIKIGICLTIPPNESHDTFGLAYGTGQTQWRYKRNNAIWVQKLLEHFGNRTAENIYLIPDNSNIDCVNGFDADSNSGVHPNVTGDNQRGDTFYYWLKSFEG